MLFFENLAIYNFNLTTEEEATILSQFIDADHDLLFPYFECNFRAFPEDRAYIEERTIIRSKEKVFEMNYSFIENELVYWYKPHDRDDLIHIINRDRITYRSIVVPKNGGLNDCRFKLFTYEHAIYNEEETRVLWIEEAIENDYIENICPKIISQTNE
ncbi:MULTISPECIES: hypothetical protein [Paenibacillus]|uniref:Ig-like domain-containing protein n=1 Tax=Paenibacillus cucumis (ex Kampfer et al. 2016) TaxID=1776858 RepID=A0ABS7KQY2_9BACL|nr:MULTISPECIES: hypothetical protein [Paenibacillus]MBY0206574.1 hypothetical protein [Paenibacillus cucumis (ex Kampfer et al. 2016)]MDP9698344.1 hypothetical protein [Paenibacillus intestini]